MGSVCTRPATERDEEQQQQTYNNTDGKQRVKTSIVSKPRESLMDLLSCRGRCSASQFKELGTALKQYYSSCSCISLTLIDITNTFRDDMFILSQVDDRLDDDGDDDIEPYHAASLKKCKSISRNVPTEVIRQAMEALFPLCGLVLLSDYADKEKRDTPIVVVSEYDGCNQQHSAVTMTEREVLLFGAANPRVSRSQLLSTVCMQQLSACVSSLICSYARSSETASSKHIPHRKTFVIHPFL